MAYSTVDQQRPQQQRQRPKSGFSFMSNKSDENKPKVDLLLNESPKDKRRINIFAKSNPNSAINEAEPGVAQFENLTMASLRMMDHKDCNGNIIVDPDRSNPTRPRLERPLDTIRSFHAAIDSSYKRTQALAPVRSVSDFGALASRRTSTYAAYDNPRQASNYELGGRQSVVSGYYNGRPSSSYRDYYTENPAPAAAPRNPYHSRMHASARVHSEPLVSYRAQATPAAGPYHSNDPYYDSVDTVNSASAGSSEPWGNSTDPSSENSSIDRSHPYAKRDSIDAYSSPMNAPIREEHQHGVSSRPHPPAKPDHYRPSNPNSTSNPYRRLPFPQGPHGTGQTLHYAPEPEPEPELQIPIAPQFAPPAQQPSRLSATENFYGVQSRLVKKLSHSQRGQDQAGKKQGWLKRTFSRDRR